MDEKKKEYNLMYNSLYKIILFCIFVIIMLIINFCGYEDEFLAYVIGVAIIMLFDIVWKKIR